MRPVPVSNRPAILVLAIVAAAAALRLWGLTFGFPHVLAHPDEVRVVNTGVRFLSGNLDPGFFNYPTLYMYALGALDLLYCTAGGFTGRFSSLSACAASWPAAWEPFFLLARGLSAFSGIVTVWLVWRAGRRLLDQEAGLAGAAFLAVTFLHVRDSHFGVTDIAMTALVMLSVLLLVRAHDSPSPRRFAAAGAAAGLATSTKYSAALLALVVATSALLSWLAVRRQRPQDEARGLRWAGVDLRLPAFGAAMVGAFLIGTPYALLDPSRFWADASGEGAHLLAGHGILLDVGWRHHFSVTLWHGLTSPLLFISLIGIVLMAIEYPARAALLLTFPVAYYITAGRGMTVFARYMVPVLPFLCLAAGYAATQVGRQIAGAARAPAHVVSAGLVIALGAAPLIKSIQLDRLLARADSRVLASEWLRQHAPAASTVYASGAGFGRLELAPKGSRGYVTASFNEANGTFRAASADLPRGPDFIVLQRSPLVLYSAIPDGLAPWLRGYELRYTMRAFDDREARVYDQQDAFFLPLANFKRIGRPGPNIQVYARRP